MDSLNEKDTSSLGNLFQLIITDLKNGAPLWDDFVSKATKLHTCLRATLQAMGLYLEAFQKIADAATSSRGATKDIGTALTRICLRQRAVEVRVKTFTTAIMECLVNPLQEKLEDWKKGVISLDKEHSKETKRARSELKKRSTDTLRLQKKARKGLPSAGSSSSLAQGITASLPPLDSQQRLLQSGLQQLSECEGRAVRAAINESRSRFCLFVTLLKPVLDQEVALLWELSHVQEAMEQLDKVAGDPSALPEVTEQVLLELTNATATQEAAWAAASGASDRDPSPPSSLGSRKSSLGSANSLGSVQSLSSHSGSAAANNTTNSNGGWPQRASTMSQLSRPHPAWLRALSQDSGFNSHDRLFPFPCQKGASGGSGGDGSNCSTPTTACGTLEEAATAATGMAATELGTSPGNQPGSWPNLQETLQFERAASAIMADQQHQHQQLAPGGSAGQQRRPHTISSAYTQQPSRPPIAAYHFSPPPSSPAPDSSSNPEQASTAGSPPQMAAGRPPQQQAAAGNGGKPSVPRRCSSLERPSVLAPKPLHVRNAMYDAQTPSNEEPLSTPVYVNMYELAHLASNKSPAQDRAGAAETRGETEKDSSASESSLESSSGYGSQTIPLHNAQEELTINEACLMYEDQLTELMPPPPLPLLRPQGPPRLLHRPMSFSGYPPHGSHAAMGRPGGPMSRRGSTSAPPPPPIRRTSSISTVNKSPLLPPPDDLPPPPSPSFLQQQQEVANRRLAELTHQQMLASGDPGNKSTVADTVRTLNELRHQPASPNLVRKTSVTEEVIYRSASVADTVRSLSESHHHPAWKPSAEEGSVFRNMPVVDSVRNLTERRHQPASPNLSRKEPEDPKKCVADTVRTLTELRHQPASPILPRRQTRLSSENLCGDEEIYTRSPGAARKIYHDPRKLENYSPGTSRKLYEQQQHQGLTSFMVGRKTEYEDPTKLRGSLLQAIKLSKLGKEGARHMRRFSEDYAPQQRACEPQEQQQTVLLQSLSARLSQMQSGNRAYRVRTLIASQTVRDPTVVHDSLMDQIRRGTMLRRNSSSHDQPSPRM